MYHFDENPKGKVRKKKMNKFYLVKNYGNLIPAGIYYRTGHKMVNKVEYLKVWGSMNGFRREAGVILAFFRSYRKCICL